MLIDSTLLDKLTAEARRASRLRMNYDLRSSAVDGVQRMLSAMEPGSSSSRRRMVRTNRSRRVTSWTSSVSGQRGTNEYVAFR